MKRIKQILPQIKPPRQKDFNPQELVSIIYGFTRRQRRVLDSLIDLSRRYQTIYPSQTLLAKLSRFCRGHTNRLLNGLLEKLVTHQRRYNTTCVYELHPLLKNPSIASQICHLLPSIAYLSTILLTAPAASLDPNVTSSLNGSYVSLSSSLIESHCMEKVRSLFTKKHEDGESPPESSPLLREIAAKLQLSREDTLLLGRYPEATLKFALQRITQAENVLNPRAYFFKIVRDESESKTKSHNTPALQSVSSPKQWTTSEESLSLDEQIALVNKSIEDLRKQLANPEQYCKPRVINLKDFVKIAENRLSFELIKLSKFNERLHAAN